MEFIAPFPTVVVFVVLLVELVGTATVFVVFVPGTMTVVEVGPSKPGRK